jgi:hypothetical protein
MGEGNELRVSLYAASAASDYVRVLDYLVPPPPSDPAATAPAIGAAKPPPPAAIAAERQPPTRPAGVVRPTPALPIAPAGAAAIEEDR